MINGNVIRQANDGGNTWIDCSEEAFKRAKENGTPVREVHLNDESFRAAFDVWQDKTDWVQKDRRFDVLKPWGWHRADVLKAFIEHLEESNAQVIQSRDHYKRMAEEALKCAAGCQVEVVSVPGGERVIKEPMAKLPPHIYRELVSELTQTAKKHCGTDSMREALSYVLSRYVEPDHSKK
ncbi:TPA: hypothetical protein MAM84_004619 [Klebsiella pneumoniae]|nr:hypothetical protein [Klebsiella pneumoniae]